ncbi:MAG: ATP-grasp domain-containing protein [Candidatus Omnitrophota bacterium]
MKRKDKKILIAVDKEEVPRKDVCDILRCKASVEEVFFKKGMPTETLYLEKKDFTEKEDIAAKILAINPYCVFNLFEGFSDDSEKEAAFVRLLEKIKVPFTGNSSFTLSLCLSKWKAKEILKKKNIPVPRGLFVKNPQDLNAMDMRAPFFVKPCHEDASLGIDKDSLVYTKEELCRVVEKKIKEFPQGLVVEEFIGGKEYSVAFLGGLFCWPLGVSVMDYSQYQNFPPYLTYDSKWEVDCDEFKLLTPSVVEVENQVTKNIIAIAQRGAAALRCRSYFRVDVRERQGALYVLDINPNPDINRDSGFMKQAYHKGYTYEKAIEKIVRLANRRK